MLVDTPLKINMNIIIQVWNIIFLSKLVFVGSMLIFQGVVEKGWDGCSFVFFLVQILPWYHHYNKNIIWRWNTFAGLLFLATRVQVMKILSLYLKFKVVTPKSESRGSFSLVFLLKSIVIFHFLKRMIVGFVGERVSCLVVLAVFLLGGVVDKLIFGLLCNFYNP